MSSPVPAIALTAARSRPSSHPCLSLPSPPPYDLTVLYHQPARQAAIANKADIKAREEAVAAEKARLGMED